MEWMILLVLLLAVMWWLMRHSATPALPPKPKIDPRRLLAAQLIEAANSVCERRGNRPELVVLRRLSVS